MAGSTAGMTPMVNSFWYLATPYRNYIPGRTAAYIMACRLAARLIHRGISVYTPIGHSHPIAEYGGLDAVDHDLWMQIDAPFVTAARGLIVATMEGWEDSAGVQFELNQFFKAGKPIVFWDPACEIPFLK